MTQSDSFFRYRPGELGLTVWVNLIDSSKTLHHVTAYNQTVSIVEPPTSWLDPSLLLLYAILTSALLGGAYLAYTTFFDQPKGKKRSGTGPKKVKAVVPNEKTTNYPNVKPYEEEWIPEQHLKHRASKLKKDQKGDLVVNSGGETSGGEATSGGEGKTGTPKKRRGKKA
jgi:translocon-associated protein subunit alpha